MTAIGFVMLVVGYIGVKSTMPALPQFGVSGWCAMWSVIFIVGVFLTTGGVALAIWRLMP